MNLSLTDSLAVSFSASKFMQYGLYMFSGFEHQLNLAFLHQKFHYINLLVPYLEFYFFFVVYHYCFLFFLDLFAVQAHLGFLTIYCLYWIHLVMNYLSHHPLYFNAHYKSLHSQSHLSLWVLNCSYHAWIHLSLH